MEYIDWGLIGVFFFSLVAIVVLVLRKRTQLVVVNLETIIEEREARVREQLIRERMRRLFARVLQFRLVHQFAHRLDRLAHQLELDHTHAQKTQGMPLTVTALVGEADAAMKRKHYDVAEKHLVAALRHDPHDARVYHRLGLVKAATHARTESIDALTFAVQLEDKARSSGFLVEGGDENVAKHAEQGTDMDFAEMHMDLGDVLVEAGEHAQALPHFEDAAVLAPGNPRYLDALLSTAILLKNRKAAEDALEQLRATNPENEKLTAFTEQVAALEPPRKKKK